MIAQSEYWRLILEALIPFIGLLSMVTLPLSTFVFFTSINDFMADCEKLNQKLGKTFGRALECPLGQTMNLKRASGVAIVMSIGASTLGFLWIPELVPALGNILLACLWIAFVLSYIIMALYSLAIFPMLLDQLEQKKRPYTRKSLIVVAASIPQAAITIAFIAYMIAISIIGLFAGGQRT